MTYDYVVVGAGLSGLTLAQSLRANDQSCLVVEKARGCGGRMSTRRADDHQFDHGAQYFTARNHEFQKQLESWCESGLADLWSEPIGVFDGQWQQTLGKTNRYVGTPKMSSIARSMTAGLSLQYQWRLKDLKRIDNVWYLASENGDMLSARHIALSLPAPQTLVLLPESSVLRSIVANVKMLPCWALMLVADIDFKVPYRAAFINKGPLSWIAQDDSKPGRAGGSASWVLHASSDWSQQHLDETPDRVGDMLLGALRAIPGVSVQSIKHCVVHRWLYALAEEPLEAGCLWDESLKLGVCGDWCHGSRVEGAFLSGLALGREMLSR